jgi:hypothetical protein
MSYSYVEKKVMRTLSISYDLGIIVFEASDNQEHLFIEISAFNLDVGLCTALEIKLF